MRRYVSPGRVTTTTTTTEDSSDPSGERRIRRLRLTLHAVDDGTDDPKHTNSDAKETVANGGWKKKNGLVHRGTPVGREAPEQHLRATANGRALPESPAPHDGPKMYAVVQRTGSDRQQEVMARGWSVNHLQDEMRYIREAKDDLMYVCPCLCVPKVRDSLEKVRERMYGQFGGMQQSMQKLSQEIRTSNSQRRSLESEVRVRTAAMDSFDQMNSSLISANIDLQVPNPLARSGSAFVMPLYACHRGDTGPKSLLDNCQSRVDIREEVKTLRSTCVKTEEKLREKEQQLASVQAENQTLKLQVEATQEARSLVVQEATARLQRQYDQQLLEEQKKHREEIENLQSQIDEYIRRLEEAEVKVRTAEAQVAERDQRIRELERLLDCMGQEKSHLQQKLQECEKRLRLLELTDQTDSSVTKRSKHLETEASDLRDRIKHLNDMVFCQQRKVKGMIEEVQTLRGQIAQKDVFISELLDRIAIVECENNELDDKLNYFVSVQNRPRDHLQTVEVGVGCDFPPRNESQGMPGEPPSKSDFQRLPYSSQYTTCSTPPRTAPVVSMPSSRLESSLLRYTPVQYSRYLESSHTTSRDVTTGTQLYQSESLTVDGATSTGPLTASSPADATAPALSSPPARGPSHIYTPFMRLMEISANIKIE
ncbi:Myocardial zonula adherens protein [Merluccius polli]|uniref:Myocardial zonula adherens protein n=1 Tax=Merluccius polli TaxID=89951 RepID=A0AA47MAT3_MERPO|nr:Myocardial zonula adherens protein [Merluccius polli]